MTLLYTVGVVIALAEASGRCGRCTPLTAFTTVGWLPRVRTTGA